MQLDHKLIPVRNIDLKFNLNDTPHFLCHAGEQYKLEDAYFSGLQDHFRNAHIKLTGKVDVLGICFNPEGLYPFLKIPIAEFKNQLLGTGEVGFIPAKIIGEKLKEAPDITARLNILEVELISLLDSNYLVPKDIQQLFTAIKQKNNSIQISEFCKQNQINSRRLERVYNKYIGLPGKTYATLNRFQNSMNQLLYINDYSRLSEIALENGYFDQTHFIKEFKRFTGTTPREFLRRSNSMLQVGKLEST